MFILCIDAIQYYMVVAFYLNLKFFKMTALGQQKYHSQKKISNGLFADI